MTVERIQVRQTEGQRATVQELTVGGERLRLRANYNAITDRWYLTILDLSDTVLLGGIACVPGVDLLRPYKHIDGVPSGQLFIESKDRTPPTFVTMDVTSKVLYRP